MKKTFLSFGFSVLIAGLTTTSLVAQTGGGGGASGGGAAAGGSTGAGAAAGGNTGAGANVAVPPVREPLPPTFNGATTTPNQGGNLPGAGAQGNGSVNAGNNAATGGFNGGTGANPQNSGGSNNPAALSPASRGEFGTNRVYGTNQMATNSINGTNGSGLGPRDIAATEFDRNLIIRFRGTLIQRLGGTAAAWAPVTLNANNGVVTVGGVVSSTVIKQRVVATLQTFPGVIRVIDQLSIDTNLGASTGANAGASVVPTTPANGAATAGARSPAMTNRPVLSPTGRPTPAPPAGFTTISNTPPVTTP